MFHYIIFNKDGHILDHSLNKQIESGFSNRNSASNQAKLVIRNFIRRHPEVFGNSLSDYNYKVVFATRTTVEFTSRDKAKKKMQKRGFFKKSVDYYASISEVQIYDIYDGDKTIVDKEVVHFNQRGGFEFVRMK